jgi:hypothetical protein
VKKIQENSENSFGTTYIFSTVALENAGVDLDICTHESNNSSALEVACPPPRHSEKSQERSGDHHSSTYVVSGVGVKGRIMDDKSSTFNGDCPSVLKVVCGPPRIGAKKIRKILGTASEVLTSVAVLLSKVLV